MKIDVTATVPLSGTADNMRTALDNIPDDARMTVVPQTSDRGFTTSYSLKFSWSEER